MVHSFQIRHSNVKKTNHNRKLFNTTNKMKKFSKIIPSVRKRVEDFCIYVIQNKRWKGSGLRFLENINRFAFYLSESTGLVHLQM